MTQKQLKYRQRSNIERDLFSNEGFFFGEAAKYPSGGRNISGRKYRKVVSIKKYYKGFDRQYSNDIANFSYQLSFKFEFEDTILNENVVCFVSYRSSIGALNTEVGVLFRHDRRFYEFCSQLYHMNIIYIGDLIQMPEDLILGLLNMNYYKLSLLKKRLDVFQFHLNMKVPGWKRPSEFFGKLCFY